MANFSDYGDFAQFEPTTSFSFTNACRDNKGLPFNNISLPIKDLETFKSPLGGDGLKASRAFIGNEILLKERPLLSQQTLVTKKDVLVCSNCMRFIGNVDIQLDYLSRNVDRQELTSKSKNFNLNKSKEVDGDFFSEIIPCSSSCGELYCSSACANSHFENGHKLLCTGEIAEEDALNHPLIKFKIHACSTNEIFLLVADIFSKICIDFSNSNKSNHDYEFLNNYVRNNWWEAAVCPDDSNEVEFQSVLKNLVSESYSLLKVALDLEANGLEKLLDEEYFSRTIGMFEQNNFGIRLKNPLADFANKVFVSKLYSLDKIKNFVDSVNKISDSIEECPSECSSEWSSVNSQYENLNDEGSRESVESKDEETKMESLLPNNSDKSLDPELLSLYEQYNEVISIEGEDKIFPPLDGTAFYSILCKLNHSCIPNVRVKYAMDKDLGLIAELFAIKPIFPGEELLQSYIDQNLDFFERSRQLKDYGFNCSCQKCIEQI